MKYAVIKCINGSYEIHSEGWTDLSKAKVNFHGLCQTLWNAPDVIKATVKIVNEQLDCVEGYMDVITHEVIEVITDDGQKSRIIEDSRG